MPASLTDLLSAMLNGVQAIEQIAIQLRDSFPPISGVSTSSIPGSSESVAVGTVQTSSGGTYRILLLASS